MTKLRIIYYPVMHGQLEIADALGRACWYFYPWVSAISEILIGSAKPVSPGELGLPELFDASIEQRRSALLPLTTVRQLSNADLLAAIGSGDDVLLLNWDTSLPPPDDLVRRLKEKARYYQVDPRNTRNEGSFYLWASRNAFGATKAATDESKQALNRLANAVRSENAYIFGTGPSLSRLDSFDFPDGQAIIINSMVRNTELLDRLDVLAIAAGDPIFHAGCSRYAAAFRAQLVNCMDRYKPFLLVPLRDYEMYKSFIPAAHHERIVGLPFDAAKPYNLDLRKSFYVNPKPNILTLVLLPVAATFFKNILVSGCDGRPRSENSYFWSHDKKSQFNDEMDNIKQVHPAFFEISYDQYYSDHEQTVSEVIEAIESKGKRVESLTPSFIDAFGSRYRGIKHPRLICIDPDAVSEHGHYLNYDDLLAGEAARRDVDFTLFGPLEPQPAARNRPWQFRPTFSCRSWQLRQGAKAPSAKALDNFRSQLSAALGDIGSANEDIVLFMYCGSPETAEVIADVLKAFPRASACINLFWLSLLNLSGGEYVEVWRDRIQRLSQSHQVTLTASSSELADEIERSFGLRLPVLPHPSTTFPDSYTATSTSSGTSSGQHSSAEKVRVLFPGSGTEGKGWEETLSALPALENLLGDRCEFSLRIAAGSPTDVASQEMLKQIRDRVRLIEGVLSRAEFTQMLEESDVIVLPYNSWAFRNRTSGLLVDALRLGKPVIAIRGSWLGNRIEEYRCGIALDSAEPDQIRRAIETIGANYESYANAARSAFDRFSERNSWKALLDVVLSAADSAALHRVRGERHRAPDRGPRLMESLKICADRPAIVLGNGPSLKGFDFERFKAFDVFGMNAAYRYWDEIGWYPRFYSCLDDVVGMSHAEQIARLIRNAPQYGIERFLLRRKLIDHIGDIENADRIVDFDRLRLATDQFSTQPLTTGSHTLIWAASLGFRQIYVLGVDCNYVEIVPGAERREGAVLEITRAAENPNYFFAGYQQVGDKYNIPNSTSPELHLDSWRAAVVPVRGYGARVLNANLQSRVDAFDFCRIEDVERNGTVEIIPRGRVLEREAFYAPSELSSIAFERSAAAQMNECNAVYHLLHKPGKTGVMLDVGAHLGGMLRKFAEAGWSVFAFEPDPVNRGQLMAAFASRSNVVISDEAISDRAARDVPFFASEESTGISGLSAFRDSHHEVARVSTVTLSDIVIRHGLTHIDFLKVDVEGFEMAVLRGLDFGRVKPRVIEVEFEDEKTKSLGYTSHDLACFLMQHGYTVYVSEWHPVERYGVKHSWRRVQKYPCAIPEESWGNLIAFMQDPPAADLIQAVRRAVDRPVRFADHPDDAKEWATPMKPGFAQARKPKRKEPKAVLKMWAPIAAALLVAAVAVWTLPGPGALFAILLANLGIAAWMVHRTSKSLKKRSRRQRKALRQRIRRLQEQQVKDLQRQVKDLQERLSRQVEAQRGTAKLVGAQRWAFTRLNGANATRARVHTRLLEDTALERLERHWAPLFGQQFRPSALAYLAHQICLSEDRCEGRLATTIETAMLRLLALRSLKGPRVEVLEIGTLFGLGVGLLHRHRGAGIGRLRLTLIDPLNGYYGAGEPDPITGVLVGPETLTQNLAALDVPAEDVRVLRGLSTDPEIVTAARQDAYDLLLIDGDHSGAGVRRDFELYGPMVRPGGLVLFDDYDTPEWPEIKPAVEAMMAETGGWEWLGAEYRTGIARRVQRQA